jgi:hypothetical protein
MCAWAACSVLAPLLIHWAEYCDSDAFRGTGLGFNQDSNFAEYLMEALRAVRGAADVLASIRIGLTGCILIHTLWV